MKGGMDLKRLRTYALDYDYEDRNSRSFKTFYVPYISSNIKNIWDFKIICFFVINLLVLGKLCI